MKVRIDTTKCSGIGMCEMTAPDIFEIGEDGQAHVLATAGADSSPAADAAANCPTGAITIED